jgi:hypothetical protein
MTVDKWPVYAMTAADWKAAMDAVVRELPEPETGSQKNGSRGPTATLMPDATTVDPLSLMLSLQKHPFDRIQLALEELKGQLPW